MHMLTAFLEWLTRDKSLAVATWGLVVATLIIYLDSRDRGKDQVERWKREDRLREEAERPKAVVELAKRQNAPHVVALCYNLGEHPFIIDRILVSVQKGITRISPLLGPYVVLPGAYVPVTVDCSELLQRGKEDHHDTSIVFQLKGASGTVSTEPVWFSFYPDPSGGYGWSVGGPADRLPGMIVQQPRMIPNEESKLVF
jgi:hypothetical protein